MRELLSYDSERKHLAPIIGIDEVCVRSDITLSRICLLTLKIKMQCSLCPGCGVYFSSILGYNQSSNCPECTEEGRVEKEVSEHALGNSQLKSSLTFLRLQFDNEPTSGVLGGDVVIVVQGLTDQLLHAHKFILVRVTCALSIHLFSTFITSLIRGLISISEISY